MANGRKNELPLQVDQDIAPLQARFFDYANTQVRPENRQRAYELINQTFGSVQAVREAQREREREQLDLENKRIAVETNRLQLAEARESVAARQEQAKVYGQVRQELAGLAGREDLTPEQKHQEMLNFGAAYGDLIGGNSALKYQYGRFLAATKPAAGTTKTDTGAKPILDTFGSYLKDLKDSPLEIDSDVVDEGLQALDSMQLISPKDREKLYREGGLSVLVTPEEAKEWGPKADWRASAAKRYEILQGVLNKAKFKSATRGTAAPAAAATALEPDPVGDLFE